MVDLVSTGQVFSEYFGVPVSVFHPEWRSQYSDYVTGWTI